MVNLSTFGRSNSDDHPSRSDALIETLEPRQLFAAGVGVTAFHPPMALPGSVTSAAAAPTVKPAATTTPAPITRLGGNLSTQTAINPDHAYVDLVKAAVLKNPTGGFVPKDAHGWPLADFSTRVWDGGYGGIPVDPGVYHMSFTGPSSTRVGPYLAVAGQPKVSYVKTGYNPATGVNTYNVTVPPGVTKLGFAFTHTAGQVKNFHVIQPGYDPNNHPTFTNKYVNFLKSLSPYDLRFMDFTLTNNNLTANWSDRLTPADASYAYRGAPWEDVVSLANMIHTNVWINVPFHATDDYVKQLATLLRKTLDPSLNIFVELSNEVWNTAFEQGASNAKAALAEVQAGVRSGHPSDLNYDHQPVDLKQTDTNTDEVVTWSERRTARRLVQISNIFKSVWTSAGLPNPINTKVRAILGGQGPRPARFTNMLTYVNAVYGAPKKFFYGIGVAPYWGLNIYQDQLGADGQYHTLSQNITEAQALDGMNRSVSHYEVQNAFANTLTYGSKWGLRLEIYEGGVDTHGPFNIPAKEAANLDPSIKPLMTRYLNAFYSQGGDVLDWYRLGAQNYNTADGTFGITDNLNNLNEPKEQVFRTFRGV